MANTTTNRRQVLDLGDLSPERAYVTLAGRDFDLKTGEDFGITDQARIKSWYGEILELQQLPADELTPRDAQRLTTRMRDFVAIVVIGLADRDCPRHGRDGEDGEACSCDLLGRLLDHHLIALMQAFSAAAGIAPAPTPPTNRASRRTSEKSSQRSKGSTAAGRRTGSTSS